MSRLRFMYPGDTAAVQKPLAADEAARISLMDACFAHPKRLKFRCETPIGQDLQRYTGFLYFLYILKILYYRLEHTPDRIQRLLQGIGDAW